MQITMLAYPGMTPLDLIGPLQVWNLWPEAEIQVVWKNTDPIKTDTGMDIVPTHSFDQAFTNPDILFVPGGVEGTLNIMQDQQVLDFLRQQSKTTQWFTSVCTGALVLGAAGLLNGYKATTHWIAKNMLQEFGAIATEGRWVIDRNRITGGGVTAGIDFGLALMAKIAGDEIAKRAQLIIEYSPKPPFNSGIPAEASEETLQQASDHLLSAFVN